MAESRQTLTEFGKYDLLELLEGALTGSIYRARDREQDREVLLKVIAPSASESPRLRGYLYDKWVRRESALEHPNVLGVLEVGEVGGQYYVTVPDMGGERLVDRLREGPCDWEEGLEIVRQAAEGLRAAHRNDIVHGQLKPSDILLTTDKMGRLLVKVVFVDLGVAPSECMVSVYGEVVGTPKYMAPEVIQGSPPTHQGDIFSLGVVAYTLLTGEEPFPSDHVMGYLFSNCKKEVVPPHEMKDGVPREVSAVICRMLEKQPGRRYRSAQSVIDDLDRCKQSVRAGRASVLPMGADSAFARRYELPTSKRRARERGRFSRAGVTALILAVVALGLIAYGMWSGSFVRGPRSTDEMDAGSPSSAQRGEDESREDELPAPRPSMDAESRRAAEVAREESARRDFDLAMKDWERYSRTGQYDLAIAAFKRVAAAHPGTPYVGRALEMTANAHIEYAGALMESQMYEAAAQNYERAIGLAPEDSQYADLAKRKLPGALAGWADYCNSRGLYEKALSLYRRIAQEYPGTAEGVLLEKEEPQLYFNLGYVLWKQKNRVEEALDRFQYVVKHYPDTEFAKQARKTIPQLYLDLARQKVEQKQWDAAQQQLSLLRQAFPESSAAQQAAELEAGVLYVLHDVARNSGDMEAAAGYFQELVKNYPASREAVRVRRERLALVPEQGAVLYSAAEAENRLRQAESYADEFDYAPGIAALREIIRYSRDDTPAAVTALAKLPEWSYFQAVHLYGRAKRQEAEKLLEEVAATYGRGPWGRAAAAALQRIKNPPQGMVYVPEGPFFMGTTLDEIEQRLRPYDAPQDSEDLKVAAWAYGFLCETPQHLVTTGGFYIDVNEVTNAQYQRFVDVTDHTPPPHWPDGKYPEGEENQPVVNVTVEDAKRYAVWAGKRLPTEAEWEKAARGVDARNFPWGDVFENGLSNHMRDAKAGADPVGSYPRGASPYGCLDMIGNVMEWTSDWFEAYPGSESNEEVVRAYGEKYGATYVSGRGGAWYQHGLAAIPTYCTSRYPLRPDQKNGYTGFRCVKDVEQP